MLQTICAYLLPTKGIVCGDHLSHEHGSGHHDCATSHWSCYKLGHQLLPCWEPGSNKKEREITMKKLRSSQSIRFGCFVPDLSVLCEGGHGCALLCVVLREAGADLQHVGLAWLGNHHGVV